MSDASMQKRRGFLKRALGMACGTASLSIGGGLLGALTPAIARAAYSDYKALVCVYLNGGNDSFNWLVPRDSFNYGVYSEARGGLAVPSGDLLPIAAANALSVGVHPSCESLVSLFDGGDAAFVANCGVLMAPTTKADYDANRQLPPSLYSHADQQDHWMSARPGAPKQSGWAGRLHGIIPDANGNSPLAMNLSLAGPNLRQSGGPQPAYILGSDGAALIDNVHSNSANYYPYIESIGTAEASTNALERGLAHAMRNAFDLGEFVDNALMTAPSPTTVFDEDVDIGRSLRMTARMIAARAALGAKRQVFVVEMGGFDTHDSQGALQPVLFAQLDAAIAAFHAEMQLLGLADSVTLFTSSEFGRTLTANGDGTDHGWGAHQLVVGGAVRGGRIYGAMPDLTIDGPDDAGWGRIIPTTSTEQYLGTLVKWFLGTNIGLGTVFPDLTRFTPRTLGFMA